MLDVLVGCVQLCGSNVVLVDLVWARLGLGLVWVSVVGG